MAKDSNVSLRDYVASEIATLRAELGTLEAKVMGHWTLDIERESEVKNHFVEIRAHRQELDQAREKAVEAAFKAAEQAVLKAEVAQQRVNVTQNEFRGALNDQQRALMPRKEFEAQHAEFARQLSELRDTLASLRTQVAVGPPSLADLQEANSREAGYKGGVTATQAFIFSAGAILVSLGGVVMSAIILLTR